MKIFLILGLCTALSLPTLARSEAPIDGETLGRMEGMLTFCAKADTQSAVKYQEALKLLTRNQSTKDVESARKSKEYQDAFESINADLGKASTDDAVKACSAFLEGK